MSEWISVKDEKPPFDVEIIVHQPSWKGQPVTIATFIAIDSSGLKFEFDGECRYSVTHWMPLPKPPEDL